MIKIQDTKHFKKITTIMMVLLIPFLIEILVFNFSYFKLNGSEKREFYININDLEVNDLTIEGNKISIVGDNPYFKLNSNIQINNLDINVMDNSCNFDIYGTDNKDNQFTKIEVGDVGFKTYMSLEVKEKSNNTRIHIVPKEENKDIYIKSIVVDNTLKFNLSRYIFIVSILTVIALLTVFRELVKGKLHIAFLIVSLVFGTMISISIPTYFSYDEREHFIKTYQTASFDFGFNGNKPIDWIDNIDDFFKFNGVSTTFSSYGEKEGYINEFYSNDYSNKKFYKSTAQTYLFIPYIPAAIGIFIGKVIGLPFIYVFYLGRIFSLIAYSIIGCLTIKYIKIGKRLVFMIGLLPATLFVASAYSVDPMTTMTAMATVAIFINMISAEDNSIGLKHIIGFVICVSICIMCKVAYAPLCILILGVSKKKFKVNKVWLHKIVTLFVVGMVTLFTMKFATAKDMNQWQMPGVDVGGQVKFILMNIPTYIKIVIKYVSETILLYFQGPIATLAYCESLQQIWFIIILIALFIVAIIDNESEILYLQKRDKIFILFAIILSWGLVLTALYVTFTAVASNTIAGVQGRYFAPLILPTLLLFKNKSISTSLRKENINYAIFCCMSASIIYMTYIFLITFNS